MLVKPDDKLPIQPKPDVPLLPRLPLDPKPPRMFDPPILVKPERIVDPEELDDPPVTGDTATPRIWLKAVPNDEITLDVADFWLTMTPTMATPTIAVRRLVMTSVGLAISSAQTVGTENAARSTRSISA